MTAGRRVLLALTVASTLEAAHAAEPAAATVNGQPVTAAQVAQAAEQMAGSVALSSMVLCELIRQAAVEAHLWPSDVEVDVGMAKVVADQFRGDKAAYAQWLQTGGRREEVLRSEVAVQLAAYGLRSKAVVIDEAALRTYYDEHRDAYRRSETFNYRMLTVPWPLRDGHKDTDEVALAYAEQVLAEIKQGGDFEAFARKLSDDPVSQERGGWIGPQPLELLPADFGLAFANAVPNQVIDRPVRFGDRYVLLQFVRRDPAVEGTYEQVRPQVEADLMRDRLIPQKQFLADLVSKATVAPADPRYRRTPIVARWISPNGLRMAGWLETD